MPGDAWNPTQYERFAAQRRQPFDDLLGLLRPTPGGRAVDLGCGSGELTVALHRAVGAASTLGLDSSPAMLAKAPAEAGVTFAVGDLSTWSDSAKVDIVFANAALQWVPDHERVLAHLTSQLAPGGQLAIQVPYNHDHASHVVIAEVAKELMDDPPADPVADNVLAPTRYAELLNHLGFVEQHVRMQVYGHVLASTAEVVEWTKGTSLTRFNGQPCYEELEVTYRDRLVARLGDQRPFFYAFKRILLWGRTA